MLKIGKRDVTRVTVVGVVVGPLLLALTAGCGWPGCGGKGGGRGDGRGVGGGGTVAGAAVAVTAVVVAAAVRWPGRRSR